MKYEFEMAGFKVPRFNEVLRWYWRQRHEEQKRTRQAVKTAALFTHGLGAIKPLSKAQVCITAYGPYHRRDGDSSVFKFLLDALIAKKITVNGKEVGREWGCILDDNRACIGEATTKTVLADDYKVRIEVYEV